MSVDRRVYPRAELDLDALRHNARLARRLAGGASVMAAVKADAYGHGIEHVVPALRGEGVSAFGVANVAEGVELRDLGVTETILVFADPVEDQLPECASHRLDVTVGQASTASAVVRSDLDLSVHVKIDTGMHRLGFAPSEAAEALRCLTDAPHVDVVAAWTHLATADEEDASFALQQIGELDSVLRQSGFANMPTHVANSGALQRLPEAVQGRRFVRPGGLLYGLPASRTVAGGFEGRPVMRLVSRVLCVRTVEAGETVSYGRTWRASEATLVATVAGGYGDGLPRQLSGRGEVAIGEVRYPIAGRVCMDMLMLDLGPPSGPGAGVRAGDEVVLFGGSAPAAIDLADAAETISYALTCGLTGRVVRVPAPSNGFVH